MHGIPTPDARTAQASPGFILSHHRQGSMYMNGSRSIVVNPHTREVIFEGSEEECVAYADKQVLTCELGPLQFFIYTPRMRVTRENPPPRAAHLSTKPRT